MLSSARPFLSLLVERGELPHALLFSGGQLKNKEEDAYWFSSVLLGGKDVETQKRVLETRSHPDLHLYFPEGATAMHPLSAIRSLIQEISLKPYSAPWKVCLLFAAEKMLPTSAQALLKTLEEPPDQTILILLTKHPEKLLPTILSRCRLMEFPDWSLPPINAYLERVRSPLLEVLSRKGAFSTLDPLLKESEEIPELQEAFFETILMWFRDRLLITLEGCSRFLTFPLWVEALKVTSPLSIACVQKEIQQAKLALERGMKFSYVMEVLLLKFLYKKC